MAEDSFTIDLPADSDISVVALVAEVLDSRGEPMSWPFVTFRLRGDGSLDSITTVLTQQRRTSRQGVSVTWYAFPVVEPKRPLKATVSASCPYAESVKLRPGTLLPFNRPRAAKGVLFSPSG